MRAAPQHHGRPGHSEFGSDRIVGPSFRRFKSELGPQRHFLRCLRSPDQPAELRHPLIAQGECLGESPRHEPKA